MSMETTTKVKKALSELATGQRTSYTDELKSLFTSFLFVPSNNGLKDLWTATQAIVTSRFSPEFTGKTLALYLWNRNLSISSRILCKPIDGAITVLAWREFLTLDPTTVDWTYLPQIVVSYDTEIELWSLWLARVPSLELEGGDPQVYVRAFHSAGPTVLRNIRKNIPNIDLEESKSPVGCLNAFRKLFPALLSPPKLDDVSRTEESLRNLKSLVPYFEMDDVVFGKHYDFFDGQVQLKFNQLYTRALINRLFLPSGHLCYASEAIYTKLYFLQRNGELIEFLRVLRRPFGPTRKKYNLMVSEKQHLPMATDLFVRLLRSHAAQYGGPSGRQYRAPMITLCNGSGVGKTRLAMSTASTCMSILICLEENNFEADYSTKSFVADYILDSRVLSCSSEATSFLVACLRAWIEIFKEWFAIKEEITHQYQCFYGSDEDNFMKIMGDLIALNEPSLTLYDICAGGSVKEMSFHEIYWRRVIKLHGNPIGFNGPRRSSRFDWWETDDYSIYDNPRFDHLLQRLQMDTDKHEYPTGLSAKETHFNKLNQEAKKLLVGAGLLKSEDQALFVITFDRAIGLLNTEKYQDSALRHLRHGSRPFLGGFILLIDTASQLTYIAPPPRYDHGAAYPVPTLSFPPLITLPLLNIVRCRTGDSVILEVEPATDGYASLRYDPFEPINLSRPIYAAYFNVISDGCDTEGLLMSLPMTRALAYRRFKGPRGSSQYLGDPKHPLLAAILTCRLSTKFLSFRINSNMMAFHEAMVTHFSWDTETLTVAYEGEPMASNAAANYMYGSEAITATTIRALRHSLENNLIELSHLGGVGPILTAVYCLLARDHPLHKLIKKDRDSLHNFGQPQLVSVLLSDLLSPAQRQLLKDYDKQTYGILMNSFTTFTCFVPVSQAAEYVSDQKLITTRILLWALNSQVALYLPPNTNGIDIVIPIVVGKPGDDSVEMTIENIGAIVAKAASKPDNLQKEASKELFEDGIPVLLGIVMNFGRESSHDSVTAKNESSFPIVSVSSKTVQGALDLSSDICKDLDEISSLDPEPISSIRKVYYITNPSEQEVRLMARHCVSQLGARLDRDVADPSASPSESELDEDSKKTKISSDSSGTE